MPPKFKVGQVVSVKSFYGNFGKGETGPGYRGKRGWRHGFEFGKIVKILPGNSYFLDGWYSALPEDYLRALTKKEINYG
jgi:hypothetical protein